MTSSSGSAVSRPWHIAYISPTGEMQGGGEVSLLHLLGALDPNRVRPWVVAPREGGLTRRLRDMGACVRVLYLPKTLIGVADGTLRTLVRWMRQEQIALVHANSSGRELMLSGLAARLLSIPLLWHARIGFPTPIADIVGAILASRIVATSSYVCSKLSRWPHARSKLTIIPNPLDLSGYSGDADRRSWRNEVGIGEEVILVGTVGRMDAWKRFDLAIRTVAMARIVDPRIHLVLIGEGPEHGNLERLAERLAIREAVHFLGWRDDVPKVIRSMDVLIHTMGGEGFGRVLVEAMACGVPVVAAVPSGASDIVVPGETGLLVGSREPEPFAQAVLSLAQDPVRRVVMGASGRWRVHELYDSRKVAAQVLRIYEELLG